MSPVAATMLLVIVCGGLLAIVAIAVHAEKNKRAGEESEATEEVAEGAQGKRLPRNHRHVWRYHSSKFNEPTGSTFKGSGAGIFELTMKSEYGFTNITYTCADEACTEVRIESHIGQVSDPYHGKEYKPDA